MNTPMQGNNNPRRASPIDEHVGSRVRLRRMLLGFSQEKLGELLGLTFQQVQKYEKGTNRIGASRLFEMSQILGVPVQYFYEDLPTDNTNSLGPGFAEDADDADHQMVSFLGSREGIELNRAFIRIKSAKVRRSIVELARSLADDESDADAA